MRKGMRTVREAGPYGVRENPGGADVKSSWRTANGRPYGVTGWCRNRIGRAINDRPYYSVNTKILFLDISV